MLDDFFTRALIAAIGVALVAGPVGCFIVWRRLAYFGDALAHASLLGVALGLLMGTSIPIAVFLMTGIFSVTLFILQRRHGLASDSLLGILSHGMLASGMLVLALLTFLRVDLMAFLFGDILAVSRADIGIVWLGGALVLAVLAVIWRPLFAATVNDDLARAEGLPGDRTTLIYMLLVALVVAFAIKITGALLINALLIIPAATARRFVANPEVMAVVAAGLGVFSAIVGLYTSLWSDVPSGPAIVGVAFALFLISLPLRLKS